MLDVAPAAPNGHEPQSSHDPVDLPGRERPKPHHTSRLDADSLDADDSAGWNALDVEVELDRLTHVVQGFLGAAALGVATGQHGHVGDPGTCLSFFQDDVEFHGERMRNRDTYNLLGAQGAGFLGAARLSFLGGGR